MVMCALKCLSCFFILVACGAVAYGGDLIWSQDLNHSYHHAYSYCEIKIHNQDYQNYAGGGHQMAVDDDDEAWTAGQQAATGASTAYNGNGITNSTASSSADAWCTGDGDSVFYTHWTLSGAGYVNNGTLTDYEDIDDEFSWVYAYAGAEHDDRWKLESQTNSTTAAPIYGSLHITGISGTSNPWTGIDLEIQHGVDTNNDGQPDSWTTVFYAYASEITPNISVGYGDWDTDEFGTFLNWFEDEVSFETDVTFNFLLRYYVAPGQWVRVINNSGSAQDIGADDGNTNTSSHTVDFSLSLSSEAP